MMDTELSAPEITPAMVAALMADWSTVVVLDVKTGAVSWRKLDRRQQDDPRWVVLATQSEVLAAAARSLTADLAREWAA